MTFELEALLRPVIEAVSIDRNGPVYWFGQPIATVGRDRRRQQRTYDLIELLRRHLYRRFYCAGFALPWSEEERGEPGDREAFTEILSAANCGAGRQEAGWRVVARGGSTYVVQRDGLRLSVDKRRLVSESRGKVTLRGLKELRAIAPGFYTALGNRELDGGPLLRIYWNIRADGAAPFIRKCTRSLNRACIPFRAKVLTDPLAYSRCDAAVLYIARSDWRRAYRYVRHLHDHLRPALKPLTPAFTKPVADGVAVAEDPLNGDSFGEDRCRIVAEGLVRAHRNRKPTLDDRFDEVVAAFRRRGVDLSKPFVNAGSRDVYEPLPR